MFYQIEVTTKCNYRCFYCAGRDMKQQNMTQDTFKTILAQIPLGNHTISLQGEGEPTVHPQFWEFVSLVSDLKYIPYTITNGSIIDPKLANQYFATLGISLDTLDAVEAERIGRLKLDQVLSNLGNLVNHMGADRIVIHTVDYGQDTKQLKDFVKHHRFRHIIQPLQIKDDYAYRYPEQPRRAIVTTNTTGNCCRYITTMRMKYFDVNGIEFPCCYIKDTTGYLGTEGIRSQMINGTIPSVCKGCRELPINLQTISTTLGIPCLLKDIS
jgi:molybdenum cofactor biosynthesis enzyme MoaA